VYTHCFNKPAAMYNRLEIFFNMETSGITETIFVNKMEE
jgi:hypothetical protein